MTIKYLFYILIAICGAVAVYSLFSLLDSKNANASVKRRVKNIARDVDVEDVRNNVLKEKKEQKRKDSGLKFVSERLEAELATAGIKISGEEFLRIWVIVAFVPALLLLAFGLSVISALGIMLIGIIVPPLLVSNAKKKKNSIFDKQLGDALMVMSNSLRAGYTFQQSMDSIAKDMQPPISDEFRLVVREIDMGASLETALNHLVERTRNDDVKILVSAVLISATVGANLADVLDNIAGTIRGRLEMKEQVRVLTAQGRLSGLIVGGIPIVLILFLMVMNPTYIGDFISTPTGLIMLAVGGIMEVLGFIVINRIVNIKY